MNARTQGGTQPKSLLFVLFARFVGLFLSFARAKRLLIRIHWRPFAVIKQRAVFYCRLSLRERNAIATFAERKATLYQVHSLGAEDDTDFPHDDCQVHHRNRRSLTECHSTDFDKQWASVGIEGGNKERDKNADRKNDTKRSDYSIEHDTVFLLLIDDSNCRPKWRNEDEEETVFTQPHSKRRPANEWVVIGITVEFEYNSECAPPEDYECNLQTSDNCDFSHGTNLTHPTEGFLRYRHERSE